MPYCHSPTGVMHTQSQIHTLTYNHTNTWKMHTETPICACGIVTFLPDIPASVCQGGLQLEGHNGWQRMEGKRCRAEGGQNHLFGMSHGQTGEIYDRSGSTSAAWCCGFRMPGMGVRSDSGFSLYTLSGNCSQHDWLKMAVLLVVGVVLSHLPGCTDLHTSENADVTKSLGTDAEKETW